jgi:glycogen debranching enzyme
MALFGRDSLLTSWMLLPIDSALGLGTLQTLAAYQGVRSDDESEEEPGRILHEVRFGRGTPFGSANVYYGTADATALFVMLAAELRRWRGREPETDALLPHVDRALAWLTAQTDLHGFVRYRRRTPNGLANQGWKDSWDGITFADGRIPDSPIALAEVQAYTYAAYSARAEWASELGDHAAETSWRRRAMQLRSDFDSAFWLPDSGWYALGLDRSGSAIDALSSNVGHCLWTGIADEARAPELAQHLLSPEMFSGWGIRTLATTMQAYDPMSYHNGSVWPHDTALCVAGLMRYGFVSCAWQVARGLLDAAVHFRGRLPELYGGFPRSDLRHPVPYPTSCSPQAWSSAAPLLVLRALLGLEPDVVGRTVRCSPHIPSELLPLVMSDVPIGAERITVSVHPDWWEVTGLRGSGLALESDPSIRWFPGGRYACTGGL